MIENLLAQQPSPRHARFHQFAHPDIRGPDEALVSVGGFLCQCSTETSHNLFDFPEPSSAAWRETVGPTKETAMAYVVVP